MHNDNNGSVYIIIIINNINEYLHHCFRNKVKSH